MAARLPEASDRAPIRLLWLIDSLTSGGAEALTVRFVQAVERRNRSIQGAGPRSATGGRRIEPVVAFLKRLGGNPHEAELRNLGVVPIDLEARNLRDLAAFRRLLRLVRAEQIDLIHAHLAYASIWGAWAGHRTGRPVAASLHVAPPRAAPWSSEGLRRRLRAWLLGRSWVQPVAVSRAVARAWEAETSIPAGRIRVIPNGIEVGDFAGRATPTRPEEPRAPRILSVAVLRRGKGLDLLVEAAPRVLARCPGAHFTIVGDGPERADLERRIADLGLEGRVTLTGFRGDVPRLLANADLFVLPSREDAYPTVLLEAAAAGLPVVATDTGGIPEIVVPGETGLLVAGEDPEALAAALLELADSSELRRRLGKAARRRAETELSIERWLERLTSLYQEQLDPERFHRGHFEEKVAPLRLTLVEPVGRGGLMHHAVQLARALVREGVEVTLITSRNHEIDELRALGIEIPFHVEPLFRLWDPKPPSAVEGSAGRRRQAAGGWLGRPLGRWFRRCRRVLRGVIWYREQWRLIRHLSRARVSKSDAILFGDVRFAGDVIPLKLLAWRLRRVAQRPVLVDLCHNVHPFSLGGRDAGSFERVGGLSGVAFQRLYRTFDRVLVHFETNRHRLLAAYDLAAERVGVIPLGNGELLREVKASVSPLELRHRLGIAAEAPVVLQLGSLAPYKGPDLAVEALARIHGRQPDVRLVLAGPPLPGFDLADLRRRIEGSGLEDAVRLRADYLPISELATWMDMATVAVFPYRDVSQSAVVALALTAGVPPVVTRVGAMEEMVRDRETGRVVAPEDPEALARAVLGLLEDPAECDRMGEVAAEFAREELSWRRVAQEVLAEIRPLVGARSAARNAAGSERVGESG